MKITKEQFATASLAAFEAVTVCNEALLTDAALLAFADSLGIEVMTDECLCSMDVREYCASSVCCGGANLSLPGADLWIERTWADVRTNDIVRPPGRNEHQAHVDAIGPVTGWHAAPNASQYRPNESPAEWSARRVTLANVTTGDTFTPDHGVKPDAPVEILMTQAEVDAIEMLGGWTNRLDPA